ncbi:hypothetical protein ACSBR2_012503 [Camellia fascicularis]
MDEDGIGLVLARAFELRSKIINCIHRASTVLQEQEEKEDKDNRSWDKVGDVEEEVVESLLNIRDALEALEVLLSSLQALQQQQWYEKEAALAEIVYSRKKLLKKLKECKGEDLEVIYETTAFASETVEDNNDLLLPPYPNRPSHSLASDNGYLSHFPSTRKLPQNGLINSGTSIETKNSLHESERKLTQSGSQNPLKVLRLFVNTTAKTMLTPVGVISILGLAGFETRPLGKVRSLLFESLRNLSWMKLLIH